MHWYRLFEIEYGQLIGLMKKRERRSFILDFETAIDRKQDFSATLEILCEEFRQADEAKTSKKRSKRKSRRANKTTIEVCCIDLL